MKLSVFYTALVGLGIISTLLKKPKFNRRKKVDLRSRSKTQSVASTASRRTDQTILSSRLDELNWMEFERLLYLYFKDNGYEVIETGVGGNDGGVDLILIDRRTKERTAVQAKHWSHGPVGPNVIRELHSARMNVKPTCLYGWLITSNDITQQARDEAQARHMQYWHGAMLEHQLEKWGKWKTTKKRKRKTR